MTWRTDILPCDGINCDCDKSIKRGYIIDEVLGTKIPSPFLSNHNLRSPNILFEFTEDEIVEYGKASLDIVYFHHITQLNKDFKLKLHKKQEDILLGISKNRFNAIVDSRDSGIDNVLSLKVLHSAIFKERDILIVSKNRESSNILINNIKSFYESLPFFIKPGILKWNSNSIVFDNGSRIVSGGYNNILGSNWDIIVLDEYAFFSPKMADVFLNFLPTFLSRAYNEMIVCSIPSGSNHFKKIVDSSMFMNHYIKWCDIPGRNDDWVDEIIKKNSIVFFAQEYDNLFIGSKLWNRYNNLSSLLDNQNN